MLDLNSIDPSKTFYLIKDLNLDVVKNDDRLSDNERGILLNNNEVLFEYIDFYTNALGNQKFNRCFHLVESFKYKINSTDLAECKNHFLFDYDEPIFKHAKIIDSFIDLEQYKLTFLN